MQLILTLFFLTFNSYSSEVDQLIKSRSSSAAKRVIAIESLEKERKLTHKEICEKIIQTNIATLGFGPLKDFTIKENKGYTQVDLLLLNNSKNGLLLMLHFKKGDKSPFIVTTKSDPENKWQLMLLPDSHGSFMVMYSNNSRSCSYVFNFKDILIPATLPGKT